MTLQYILLVKADPDKSWMTVFVTYLDCELRRAMYNDYYS